ncbi:hypothetical protein C8R47DRAFT_1091830 [Mycena vitilis]|nr:hypothetical protein C8R47DRAFT_1091830 [Mycena vitilis]
MGVIAAPPQQPIPVAIDRFLDSQLPDATALHRQKVFDDTANLFGGFDAAVAYFQSSIDVVASGVVLGAERPPSNAIVKEANVGPLAIFYHSAFPPRLQQSAPFMWNFYIGWRGQGQSSIMKDWSAQGIRVEIMGYTGKWEDCTLLQIAPSTRVRIAYYISSSTQAKEELVFPPDPREASIPVHYLK